MSFVEFKNDNHEIGDKNCGQNGEQNGGQNGGKYAGGNDNNLSERKKRRIENESSSRTIEVYFRCCRELKIVSALNLLVEQQPHVVDQTFRVMHPEQSFFKKTFRLPRSLLIGTSRNMYVRSSDPNIICHCNSSVDLGEDVDVFVKVACGQAPQLKIFFLALYNDAYLSRPFNIWRVELKVMEKIDVAAIQGQTSRFALMLRGGLSSRLVRCYPSHPDLMSLSPDEPFMLLAGNLQQINVGVRPLKVGVATMSINVVDVEAHQLVNGWMIQVVSREPIISKHFEMTIPIGGAGESKRISFTNPYGVRKTFFLRTTRPDLIRFKQHQLNLDPGQQGQIGLKFLSARKRFKTKILVLINDEDDKNEETFAITVEYRYV
ncbi:hypothetical protein HELRODRAFT_98290 [Helobdella robusta]|uniref:Nephrocystin-4 n=1 Tax=Helobdella robusta TaxID=6412 RepID=T1G9L8_HELRO|nr:hypothetical protein HELRODRAFT_98290 [Helobdella robusta]ESO08185.1 hypothetical protein HELRODRAFT_98290 [Helobdella robusta]